MRWICPSSRAESPLGPSGELGLDGQCGAIAGVAVRIPQAGERLVQRVPRRPQPVQVEGRRPDLAAGQAGKGVPPAFQGAQITVAVLVLHRFQLAD
jgi:hypothetical protein